jgi:transcriptional antiterminator RfaH
MSSPTQASFRDRGSSAPAIDNNWYAVELHREKVAVAKANLEAQGFGTFLPQMLVPVKQFGKSVRRLRPVFPGYCFVRCSLADGRWRAVNSTRGVKRFAGPPGITPSPVRKSIMAALLERCPDGVLDPTLGEFRIGQEVRLENCAFAGALATVHELDDVARVRVLISILGSERVVTVPRASVQPTRLVLGSE